MADDYEEMMRTDRVSVHKKNAWSYLINTDLEQSQLWNHLQSILSVMMGKMIEELGHKRDMTNSEIATEMGIDPVFLYYRMQGDLLFSKRQAEKLKKLLDKHNVGHDHCAMELATKLLTSV